MILPFALLLTLLAKDASAGCIDQTPLPEGNPAVPDSPFTYPSEPDGPCIPPPFFDNNFQEMAEFEGNSVNYATTYPGQNTEFKLLCEELWACTKYHEQSVGTESGTISLCLGSSPDDACSGGTIFYNDDDVHKTRRSFVVNQCYGAGERNFDESTPTPRPINCDPMIEGDCLGYQESLTSLRNKMCDSAQTLAAREQFVPQNQELCTEIITCILDFIATVDENFDPDGDFNPQDLEPDLCDDSVAELERKKDEYCNLLTPGTGGDCDPTVVPQGDAPSCGVAGIPALPTCPDDPAISSLFSDSGANYPNCDNSDCQGYKDAVASIRPTLIPCDDNRTNAKVYAIFVAVKNGLEAALIILKNIMGGLPDFPNGLSFAAAALDAGVFALDAVLKQADYHDGLIDGAEIEATYENTRQLLDGSASIYDEVVCRCVEEKRKGHGCDSIDNDCDQSVDECDEDEWAPEIDVGQAICQCGPTSGKWWNSSESALECVESTTVSEDDCDPNISVTFGLVGTCSDGFVEVAATDRCNNVAEPKQVNVLIDEEDPMPSCSFGTLEPGSKIKSALHNADTILVINGTGPGVQHDVKLEYGAIDNCGGDIEVKVDIFSNEIEDFQSQKMALLYQSANDAEERVGLFVATTVCSVSTNGQCIKDPDRGPLNGEDFRLYTVVVTATDKSGRSESQECQVIIAPQTWDIGTLPIDFLDSTRQRFQLASHTSNLANGTSPVREESNICSGQPKKWCMQNDDICVWKNKACHEKTPEVLLLKSNIDEGSVKIEPVSSKIEPASSCAVSKMPALMVGFLAVLWCSWK